MEKRERVMSGCYRVKDCAYSPVWQRQHLLTSGSAEIIPGILVISDEWLQIRLEGFKLSLRVLQQRLRRAHDPEIKAVYKSLGETSLDGRWHYARELHSEWPTCSHLCLCRDQERIILCDLGRITT